MAKKKRGRRKTKKTTPILHVVVLGVVALTMTFLGYKIGQTTIGKLTKTDQAKTPAVSSDMPDTQRGVVPTPVPTPERKHVDEPKSSDPQPVPQTPVDEAEPELWRVRLGSFAVREEAEAALQKVRDFAPEAFVTRDGVYRLQAGAFAERERAEALADSLAERGLAPELIAPKGTER